MYADPQSFSKSLLTKMDLAEQAAAAETRSTAAPPSSLYARCKTVCEWLLFAFACVALAYAVGSLTGAILASLNTRAPCHPRYNAAVVKQITTIDAEFQKINTKLEKIISKYRGFA